MALIIFAARSTQQVVAGFRRDDIKLENLFDLIAKFDCYGIGEKMIERIGQLPGFFEANEDTGKPYTLVFSNNALMVMFNIATELLTQKTSELRITHNRILHKRRTVKDNPTIGSNMRSDAIYNEVEYLGKFISIISPLIFAGDALVIREKNDEQA